MSANPHARCRFLLLALAFLPFVALAGCAKDEPRATVDSGDTTADTGSGDTTADSGSGETTADAGSGDTTADAGSGDTSDDTGSADTTADSGSDTAPPPPPAGQVVLDACLGQTGVDERCTLVTDASACTGAACSKLVVIFSGGEMGCASGRGYASVVEGYAARGYAAVCINYFESSTGSGSAPYFREAERLDLAVREATTGAWAQTYWTGEDLLFEGISHGATAPVILMARTDLDDQPHWQGSRTTAGCFFDGAYDQAATASLLATGAVGGGPCLVPVPYNRWLERYCGPGATGANCDLTTEASAQVDTITSVVPATFAIRDFKLFECGSALPACSGDIVAGAPIEDLCQRLDASPTHTCSFVSLPDDGHLTCHANAYDQCRTWFEGLLPP